METQPQEVTPRRVRRRSIEGQIQIALDDAARAMSADISVQKLVQTRIECLLKLQSRQRNDKLRKLNDELKSAKAEIEKLKGETERLQKELAARPATRSQSSAELAERALAKYEQEKAGGTT